MPSSLKEKAVGVEDSKLIQLVGEMYVIYVFFLLHAHHRNQAVLRDSLFSQTLNVAAVWEILTIGNFKI